MAKKAVFAVFVFILFSSLSGCATLGGRKNELKIQELKNQISVLEAQIQNKDQEIESLKSAIEQMEYRKTKTLRPQADKYTGEVKTRPNVKQIQLALAGAGYNPGKIDGKIGRQTRDAIKAFQRDNGLKADGKAGKETWSLLKKYLYKKVK